MIRDVDPSNDPELRSWVISAQEPGGDFPIQNLPYGSFSAPTTRDRRIGVAIGDRVLDLRGCLDEGLLRGDAAGCVEACPDGLLNGLMAQPPSRVAALRHRISELLREGHAELAGDPRRVDRLLRPMAELCLGLPARIGDYTDFYASLFHASNVGSMFRPDNPLLPNYKWIPVGYHGRASSVVESGRPVPRPLGQSKADDRAEPSFGPSRLLDYELEVGFFIGPGNSLGRPITMAEAEDHVFGLCLVNDWSARDLQKWEYQPLGPFLAKSFLTTISPWVIPMQALAPFRAPAFARADGDPKPLPHLHDADDERRGGIDLQLEVCLSSERMRAQGLPPRRLSRGNFRDMYWTISQMVAHHTSNGCNLRPGDLLASGTVSGPEKESRGCLLELSWRGTEPIQLPTGEQRRFLVDGDELILRGRCQREGATSIGLGECRGVVEAAQSGPHP
jgi:fumarylacetoacetase